MFASACVTADGVAESNITESRNVAAGFAITLWMGIVDSLGNRCGALPGETGVQARAALTQWQGRNASVTDVALEYMLDFEDFVVSKGGETARLEFRDQRKQEFAASAREMRSNWFPEARIDARNCQQITTQVFNGDYDIGKEPDIYRTLEAMRRERGK